MVRQTCNTYDAYMTSLNFTCQPGQPGRLVWTPNDSTPDVVYYQVLDDSNVQYYEVIPCNFSITDYNT